MFQSKWWETRGNNTTYVNKKYISHSLNPEPLNMLSLQKDCTQAAVRVGANITRQLAQRGSLFPKWKRQYGRPLVRYRKAIKVRNGPEWPTHRRTLHRLDTLLAKNTPDPPLRPLTTRLCQGICIFGVDCTAAPRHWPHAWQQSPW